MSDITVYDQGFCIFPKESKSDRDRRGTNVLIAKNDTAFILIQERYLTSLKKQTISQQGRATFCHGRWGTHVKSLLHFSPSLDFCQFCGLSPERYKAHSFRQRSKRLFWLSKLWAGGHQPVNIVYVLRHKPFSRPKKLCAIRKFWHLW